MLDKWAPLEVAKFEAAMCLCGKQFALVAKVRRAPSCVRRCGAGVSCWGAPGIVPDAPFPARTLLGDSQVIGTKTAEECIEFYYAWKQSKNYGLWKVSYKQSLAYPYT